MEIVIVLMVSIAEPMVVGNSGLNHAQYEGLVLCAWWYNMEGGHGAWLIHFPVLSHQLRTVICKQNKKLLTQAIPFGWLRLYQGLVGAFKSKQSGIGTQCFQQRTQNWTEQSPFLLPLFWCLGRPYQQGKNSMSFWDKQNTKRLAVRKRK